MKILVVEDDAVTRFLLEALLKNCHLDPTICESGEEAIQHYNQAFYPILLVDLFFPGMSGFEFCQWVRSQEDGARHLIIIGTASDSVDDLRRVLKAGADDYIIKPYQPVSFQIRIAIAEQRIRNIEARRSLTAQLQKEHEQLAYQATHDSLTQLNNRVSLTDSMQAIVAAASTGPSGALLYLDLDNFKAVNDTLGHAAGDRLLIEIAGLLRTAVRDNDVVYRIGGDEFVIVLQAIELASAAQIAERIRLQVEDFVFSEAGKNFNVGVSIGIMVIDGSLPGESVLDLADTACYAAKGSGRNRIVVHRPKERMITELNKQTNRRADVKAAIQSKTFEILFQPVVDVQTRDVAFHEVLVRLPLDGALLKPEAFMPTAERYRLMPQLDGCVIEKALVPLALHRDLVLSINLSGQSFAEDSLPDFIEASFRNAGVEPERVIFEITETAVISNIHGAQAIVQRLRKAGFRFALDDFGVGYAAFAYLKELTADYLKIDGSFVRDTQSAPSNWIFIETINEMAHRLQMQCVAEYVETPEAHARLRAIGVDLAQGYLFGAPVPLAEIRALSNRPDTPMPL